MAGETILIVEDVPESLKFAAGVLRGAGYKVQIASTAEQALSTLRFLQPQLILVDFVLPGMNGLELITRLKQDSRLHNTVVVALTACAMPEDEERARQAGCDGYLTKPIDARALAVRVRQYLNQGDEAGSTASESSLDEGINGVPQNELAELRESFLEGGKRLSRQLLASLDGQFDDATASRTVHQWTGTAGLLGFPGIAYRAREVETVLRTPFWTVPRLRGPVTNLSRAFYTPAAAASEAPSEPLVRALNGKRIALIGLSADEAERMCGALEQVGAKPRLFDADQSPYADEIGICHLVLVHVRPGNTGSRWLAANGPDTILLLRHVRPPVAVVDVRLDGFGVLAAIRAESMPVRTIFLTYQPHENEILRGFSLGAEDYLAQPFSPVELAARLKRLMPST